MNAGVKRLIGVGVGPGDPELVTVKAVRVLREADVVLVPVLAGTGRSPGRRARPSSARYVDADRIRRLEFALNDTGGVTPRRAAAWQAAAAAVAEEFAAGAATVAFGTLGDPNLYSTFSYLAQTVRELVPEVAVETVAGITAMQDLASRAGLSLAEGTEPVTLVPLNGGVGALDQALARGGTVVGYKVGAAASPAPAVLRDRLQAAGRLDAAIIGARLGLPGELIAPAAEILRPTPPEAAAPAPTPPQADIPDIPYLSTLIVPALRTPGIGAGLIARPAEAQAPPEPEVTATPPAVPDPSPRRSTRVRATEKPQPVTAANGRGGWCSWGRAPARRICSPSAARAPSPTPTSSIWASSLVDQRILAHASADAEIVDSAKLPMEGVLPYYERAAARETDGRPGPLRRSLALGRRAGAARTVPQTRPGHRDRARGVQLHRGGRRDYNAS